jgi:hypothetical protein
MSATRRSYDEMIDLFARGGGVEAVIAFKPTTEAIERARDLLARSKSDSLSDEDRAELDRFIEIERLMQLVKARARTLTA